jgi:hypothetical protein
MEMLLTEIEVSISTGQWADAPAHTAATAGSREAARTVDLVKQLQLTTAAV